MSFSQQQSLEKTGLRWNRPKALAGSLAAKAGVPSYGQFLRIRRRTDPDGWVDNAAASQKVCIALSDRTGRRAPGADAALRHRDCRAD